MTDLPSRQHATVSPGETHAYYRFHGFFFEVQAPREVLSTLHRRIAFAATAPQPLVEHPVLEFHVDSGNFAAPDAALPEHFGLISHYAAASDEILIWWRDQITLRATMANGHIVVRMSSLAEATVMFATHTLFSMALSELMKRKGLYFLHAGAVSIDDRGVLLPGRSGRGKSTLTLALVRQGFGFLGDDAVFLVPTGGAPEALGFPDEVDITDTTASFFPELRRFAGTQRPGWFKQQISVPAVYGVVPPERCIPRMIVFPDIATERARSVLEPVERAETLELIDKGIVPTEATSTQAHHDVIADLVRTCDCYRLHMGADWIDGGPKLVREALLSA